MIRRFMCSLTAAVLLFAAPIAAQSESADSLALGRKYTAWFLEGYADSLWNVMGDDFKERVGEIESIENMMDRVIENIGEETEVVSENARLGDEGMWEYRRVSEFDLAPERIVWVWRISADGEIVGAAVRPESQVAPSNPR